MKKFFFLLLAIIILGGGGYAGYMYYVSKGSAETKKPEVVTVAEAPLDTTVPSKIEEINIPPSTTTQVAPVVETQKDITPSDTPKAIAEGGKYLPYTPTAVAQAAGQVVLFFWTNWSPSCTNLAQDIEKNVATLPKDITILKVNFDDEKELRQLYDVTIQHSFVQVDNTGKMIKKWRGANTLAEVLSQIQK